MWWHNNGDAHWGWMVFGMVWMVIFWGAIVWLIVWGISRVTDHRGAQPHRTPLDIARERYARGEITKEQFEDLRRTLQP